MVWLKMWSNYILCWSNNINDLGSTTIVRRDGDMPICLSLQFPIRDYTNNGTSSTIEQRFIIYFNKMLNIYIKWILLPVETISKTKNQWVLLTKP